MKKYKYTKIDYILVSKMYFFTITSGSVASSGCKPTTNITEDGEIEFDFKKSLLK